MMPDERRATWDIGTVAWGVVFFVASFGFLLEAFDVWDLRPQVIWPSLLIGLGIAVVLGGRSEGT